MRWWGWGEDERAPALPPGAEQLLASELAVQGGAVAAPVALEEVSLPDRALPDAVLGRLRSAVGAEHVLDDREARVTHAAGRSYPDLVRLRSGDASSARPTRWCCPARPARCWPCWRSAPSSAWP